MLVGCLKTLQGPWIVVANIVQDTMGSQWIDFNSDKNHENRNRPVPLEHAGVQQLHYREPRGETLQSLVQPEYAEASKDTWTRTYGYNTLCI